MLKVIRTAIAALIAPETTAELARSRSVIEAQQRDLARYGAFIAVTGAGQDGPVRTAP